MTISPYSVVTALLWFTSAAWVGCLLLRKAKKYGLAFVCVIFVLAVLRAVLPVDFTGSFVIRSRKFYPLLEKIFDTPLLGDMTWGTGLLLVWAVGAVLQLAFLLQKGIQQAHFLRRIADENASRANAKILALFREISEEAGYQGRYRLTISGEVSTVYQAGFFRPHLLLPENITEFSEQDIRNVFRHELQHFLGKDLWIKTVMQIAACLLWWDPVVWLLRRNVLQLLELVCDRRVCKNLSRAGQMSYLESLLHFLKNTTMMTANGMTLSYLGNPLDGGVKQRFQLMLQDRPSAKAKVYLWISCTLCMVLFILSYLVILQPAYSPPPVEGGYVTVIPTSQNSYILHTSDGEYALYCDGVFCGTLASQESLLSQPYCDLEIIQQGDEKT